MCSCVADLEILPEWKYCSHTEKEITDEGWCLFIRRGSSQVFEKRICCDVFVNR